MCIRSISPGRGGLTGVLPPLNCAQVAPTASPITTATIPSRQPLPEECLTCASHPAEMNRELRFAYSCLHPILHPVLETLGQLLNGVGLTQGSEGQGVAPGFIDLRLQILD